MTRVRSYVASRGRRRQRERSALGNRRRFRVTSAIDFDPKSRTYGHVLRTVPLPPPGNTGNEPHHCHTSADQKVLGCGGLLSVLKGQNDIFFFDITEARHPRFLFSTKASASW